MDVLLVVACAGAGHALSTPVVRSAQYAERIEACLQRPPPRWIFAPAWSAIYCLLLCGLHRARDSPSVSLYTLFLVLSAVWCGVFFRLHRWDAALVLCMVLTLLAVLLLLRVKGDGLRTGFVLLVLWCVLACVWTDRGRYGCMEGNNGTCVPGSALCTAGLITMARRLPIVRGDPTAWGRSGTRWRSGCASTVS
jgi:tryptophan-rich sensory protein